MSSLQPGTVLRAVPERYRADIERLFGRGDAACALRLAAMQRAAQLLSGAPEPLVDLPGALVPYIDKVALHAYRTDDGDVQTLLESNYSEDAIFEMTVSAALGAGLLCLERGLAALHGEV
jgi:hypothetical protein